MYGASTEAAAAGGRPTAGTASAYRALLDYYANARSAASHIVSLTLAPLNETLQQHGSVGNGSASYEDDAQASNSFYLITERVETEMSVSSTVGSSRSSSGSSSGSSSSATEMPVWLIPSYSVILLCAVLGNLLVISTLVQNRRMRTITNLFLLNLAISDMLLGVLCMPVTLVGTLLRNFIFGEFLCKLIQFSQGKSVWTYVYLHIVSASLCDVSVSMHLVYIVYTHLSVSTVTTVPPAISVAVHLWPVGSPTPHKRTFPRPPSCVCKKCI